MIDAGKPAITNRLAAAGLTVGVVLPVTEALAVSRRLTVWLPAVLSVTVKVWTPLSAAVKV